MIPGISMASLRRRSFAPAFDPATLALGGYWAQLGDLSDYSTTDTDGAGPDLAATWEGRASAGASGGRTLVVDGTFTTPPTTGAVTIGAIQSVDFTAVARGLRPARPPSDFMPSADVFSFVTLVRFTALPSAAYPAIGEKLLVHSSNGLTLGTASQGGLLRLNWAPRDNAGTVDVQSAGIAINDWVMVSARVNAKAIKLRVNNGADATGTLAGTGNIVSYTVGELRDADNTFGTIPRNEMFRMYCGALTDTDIDNLYAWAQATYAIGLP